MRLLKWHKFFESKDLNFFTSEEFYQVQDKHSLPDDEIRDYFTDLLDEGFDVSIVTEMFTRNKVENSLMSEDGIRITYELYFTKNIINPSSLTLSTTTTENYKEFLNKQLKYIQIFEECSERISKSEDIEIKSKSVLEIPFQGSGNNLKESGEFKMRLTMFNNIITNDLIEAKERFKKKDSSVIQANEKIIKMLKEKGVTEAERLVDAQDIEGELVAFGFLTNDEIIVIADFYYEDGLVVYEEEVDRAVKDYKEGHCSEYL